MKKSVVVEIKDNFAAVLSDDAIVSKIINKGYSIGESVDLTEDMLVSGSSIESKAKQRKKKHRFIGAAASFILFFITAFGFVGYNTAATYVSIDINPSLEYSVNLFGRVTDVHAVNEESEGLIEKIGENNFKNMQIKDAVTLTIKAMKDNNYLSVNKGNNILISTTDNTLFNSFALGDDLKAHSADVCEENNLTVTVESVKVSKEEHEQAKELGVSAGKYYLYEQVKEKDENLSLEEYMQFSLEYMMSEELDLKNLEPGDSESKEYDSHPNINPSGPSGSGSGLTADEQESQKENNKKNK